MPTTARFALFIVGATVCAAAFTACAAPPAGSSDQPAAAAESDGALTLYSGRDEELVQPLIRKFEEHSGIAVDVRYGNTAELGALLLEEGAQTPAEVFLSQDAGALGALSNENLFATLPADIATAVPAEFTSTDASWVGVTGRARVIVYDGQEFGAEQIPDSVDAFTGPEWAGRFGIAPANASFQAFVTAYRVLNGEDAAENWVSAIAANDPQIFDSNGAILAATNEGVIDAGLINHYYWFAQAAEVGHDNMRARLSYPEAGDAGSIVNVTGAGILAAGATDGDALAFIEFLLSHEAQQYFVDETFEYPLVGGIDAPEGLPKLDSLINPEIDLSDLESLEQTQELLSRNGLI
jgi:iron(III) transport system substrate-binding protein